MVPKNEARPPYAHHTTAVTSGPLSLHSHPHHSPTRLHHDHSLTSFGRYDGVEGRDVDGKESGEGWCSEAARV